MCAKRIEPHAEGTGEEPCRRSAASKSKRIRRERLLNESRPVVAVTLVPSAQRRNPITEAPAVKHKPRHKPMAASGLCVVKVNGGETMRFDESGRRAAWQTILDATGLSFPTSVDRSESYPNTKTEVCVTNNGLEGSR